MIYFLSRMVLTLGIMASGYSLVVLGILFYPWSLIAAAALLVRMAAKRSRPRYPPPKVSQWTPPATSTSPRSTRT